MVLYTHSEFKSEGNVMASDNGQDIVFLGSIGDKIKQLAGLKRDFPGGAEIQLYRRTELNSDDEQAAQQAITARCAEMGIRTEWHRIEYPGTEKTEICLIVSWGILRPRPTLGQPKKAECVPPPLLCCL